MQLAQQSPDFLRLLVVARRLALRVLDRTRTTLTHHRIAVPEELTGWHSDSSENTDQHDSHACIQRSVVLEDGRQLL
jgi:hypothetical protein